MEHPCGDLQTEIIEIGNEPHTHAFFEKLHKIRFAVKADPCHILYGDRFGIVCLDIGEYRFELLQLFSGSSVFRGTALCMQMMEQQIKMPLHCKLVSSWSCIADPVNTVDLLCKIRVFLMIRSYHTWNTHRYRKHRQQKFLPAKIASAGTQEGRFEQDVFIFHRIVLQLPDGVELSGHHKYDIAHPHFVFGQINRNNARSLLDDNDLHFLMPMHIHCRKIQRNGTQIGIVGKFRRSVTFVFMIDFIICQVQKQHSFQKDSIVQKRNCMLQDKITKRWYNRIIPVI